MPSQDGIGPEPQLGKRSHCPCKVCLPLSFKHCAHGLHSKLPKYSPLHLRDPRGKNDWICLSSLISITLRKEATSLQSPAVSADIVNIMGTVLYGFLCRLQWVLSYSVCTHAFSMLPPDAHPWQLKKTVMLFCLVVMVLDKLFQPAI